MKTVSRVILLGLLWVFLAAGNAVALPFGADGGAALQKVLDDITLAPNPGESSVDVTTDEISDLCDSYWAISGAGSSSATMVIELAGFADQNVFGVYSGSQYVPLFDGSNVAGDQAVLSIKADGSVWVNLSDTGYDFLGNHFGYFLDSSYYGGGGVWHSDTSLNSDGLDHMGAYQGKGIDTVQLPTLAAGLWTPNEFILAFEDLVASASDRDYTDMVVMVESVSPAPIPEPTTMLLLGAGLVCFGMVGRKKLFNHK